MSKILPKKIDYCSACNYLGTGYTPSTKEYMQICWFNEVERILDDSIYPRIPDDCPLKDWKEDETKIKRGRKYIEK